MDKPKVPEKNSGTVVFVDNMEAPTANRAMLSRLMEKQDSLIDCVEWLMRGRWVCPGCHRIFVDDGSIDRPFGCCSTSCAEKMMRKPLPSASEVWQGVESRGALLSKIASLQAKLDKLKTDQLSVREIVPKPKESEYCCEPFKSNRDGNNVRYDGSRWLFGSKHSKEEWVIHFCPWCGKELK